MLRRLLNFASIVCIIACLGLMDCWARSYQTLDDELNTRLTIEQGCFVFSTQGEVLLYKGPINFTGTPLAHHWPWIVVRGPDGSWLEFASTSQLQNIADHFGFDSSLSWRVSYLLLPYWFLVLAAGFLAMVCRAKWPLRFTLRSLFIVTTFLAVVLGMIALLDRK